MIRSDNHWLELLASAYDTATGFLKTTISSLIAGEDLTTDTLKVEDRSSYANLAASAAVKDGTGRLKGIFVASASATPTIKLWDNTAASTTTLVNTFTPVAGTMYLFPDVEFITGLYITISGTVDCTVFYK